jgi:hypothetical protein
MYYGIVDLEEMTPTRWRQRTVQADSEFWAQAIEKCLQSWREESNGRALPCPAQFIRHDHTHGTSSGRGVRITAEIWS